MDVECLEQNRKKKMSYTGRAKKQIPTDFTIIQDRQEKKDVWKLPWPTEIDSLLTGDYSFKEFTTKEKGKKKLRSPVAIEKKQDLKELFTSLSKPKKPAFVRELERMAELPVKCIIVGEALHEWRVKQALAIVRKKSHGRCKLIEATIWHWASKIGIQYGIPIYFVSQDGLDNLLRRVFIDAWQKVNEL